MRLPAIWGYTREGLRVMCVCGWLVCSLLYTHRSLYLCSYMYKYKLTVCTWVCLFLVILKVSFWVSGLELGVRFSSFQKSRQTHKMQVKNKEFLMLLLPRDVAEKKEEDPWLRKGAKESQFLTTTGRIWYMLVQMEKVLIAHGSREWVLPYLVETGWGSYSAAVLII